MAMIDYKQIALNNLNLFRNFMSIDKSGVNGKLRLKAAAGRIEENIVGCGFGI